MAVFRPAHVLRLERGHRRRLERTLGDEARKLVGLRPPAALIGSVATSFDDPEWSAPAHAPSEALRTLRRYESAGLIATEQADAYAAEVREAEVRHTGPERWLLTAVWDRRHNVSPCDAPHRALAQHYDIPLVTLDERLARAARALGADVVVPMPPSE